MRETEHLSRALSTGDFLDWWQLADIEERPFLAPPERLPPETQAEFVNGFRGIGDLPCRKLFRRTMAKRVVELPDRTLWQEFSLGADSGCLEFSAFWHVPTHVQRFARTFLEGEGSGEHRVRLETCGGARLWVNRQPVASFTPLTRNQPQHRSPPSARGWPERDHPAPRRAVRAGHHLGRRAGLDRPAAWATFLACAGRRRGARASRGHHQGPAARPRGV
jgi:hypothetical protein